MSRPLRESVDPSLFSSRSLLLDEDELEDDEDEVVGTPVEVSSREMPRVNAASRSSRRRMHLFERGEEAVSSHVYVPTPVAGLPHVEEAMVVCPETATWPQR